MPGGDPGRVPWKRGTNQIEKPSGGRRGIRAGPAESLKVETAEFIRSAHQSGDFLRDGRPEIAFVGRSNVGKSSLMNRLAARKSLARTSSTPGRTRSVNYFAINRRFYFVDLPGYGYAKAGRDERQGWGELASSYIQQALPRLLVLMLVDGYVGATPLDIQAYEYLDGAGARAAVAATKIDRVSRAQRGAVLPRIRQTLGLAGEVPLIPVSARSGEGVRELWSVVTRHLEAGQR